MWGMRVKEESKVLLKILTWATGGIELPSTEVEKNNTQVQRTPSKLIVHIQSGEEAGHHSQSALWMLLLGIVHHGSSACRAVFPGVISTSVWDVKFMTLSKQLNVMVEYSLCRVSIVLRAGETVMSKDRPWSQGAFILVEETHVTNQRKTATTKR